MLRTTTFPTLTDGSITLHPWAPGDAHDLEGEIPDPEIVWWEWRERAHFATTNRTDDAFLGYLGVLPAGG